MLFSYREQILKDNNSKKFDISNQKRGKKMCRIHREKKNYNLSKNKYQLYAMFFHYRIKYIDFNRKQKIKDKTCTNDTNTVMDQTQEKNKQHNTYQHVKGTQKSTFMLVGYWKNTIGD